MNMKEVGFLLLWIKLLSEWIKVRLSLGTVYSCSAWDFLFSPSGIKTLNQRGNTLDLINFHILMEQNRSQMQQKESQ